MTKTISVFQYRNGGFGINCGFLQQVEGGFKVNRGDGLDSFFYTKAAEALDAYADAVNVVRGREEFSLSFVTE